MYALSSAHLARPFMARWRSACEEASHLARKKKSRIHATETFVMRQDAASTGCQSSARRIFFAGAFAFFVGALFDFFDPVGREGPLNMYQTPPATTAITRTAPATTFSAPASMLPPVPTRGFDRPDL